MDNNILAINVPSLDILYKELELKEEIISEKLADIKKTYDELDDYCIGAQFVNNEFKNNISKTREILSFNIDSYIQDLRALQQRLNENDRYLSNLFVQATIEQNTKNNAFDNKDLIRSN